MRGSGQDAQYIPPDNDLIPPPSEYVLFLNCSDVLQLGLRSSGMLLTSVSLRALWINPWVSLVRTYILLINDCPASNYHRNWHWRLSSASSVCAKDTLNFKLQSCTQVGHSASDKSSIFFNQSIMRAFCATPALATHSIVSLLFVRTLLFLTAVYTALPAYKFQLNGRQTTTLNEYRAALFQGLAAPVAQIGVSPIVPSRVRSVGVAFVTSVTVPDSEAQTGQSGIAPESGTQSLLVSNFSST
jgi:hypothetical protein